MYFYRLYDPDPNGFIPTKFEDLKYWNDKKFGIFMTIQDFFSDVRRKDNLKALRCWAIDIDSKDKAKSMRLINRSLEPTMIVETKNGYQLYWLSKQLYQAYDKDVVSKRYESYGEK